MKEEHQKKEKKYADPAALYDLDGDRSVKTIHKKNDHRYAGDSGAPVINLNDKFKDSNQEGKDDVVEIDDDEESLLSNVSGQSTGNTTRGSAPQKDDDKSHSTTTANGAEEPPNEANPANPSEASAASRASENAAGGG